MLIILHDIFKPIFRLYGTPWGEACPLSTHNYFSDISGIFLRTQSERKVISIPDPKVKNL